MFDCTERDKQAASSPDSTSFIENISRAMGPPHVWFALPVQAMVQLLLGPRDCEVRRSFPVCMDPIRPMPWHGSGYTYKAETHKT